MIKNYVGQIINNVKVIERIIVRGKYYDSAKKQIYQTKYKCVCLNCQKEFIRHRHSMTHKILRCQCSRVLKNNLAAINRIYKEYRNGAKNRKLKFKINLEDFINLITSNCVYCNIKPKKVYKTKYYDFYYNGIDRIDSKKGYIPGNIVTCCIDCNKAKWEMTIEEFKEWLIRTYKHLIKGK